MPSALKGSGEGLKVVDRTFNPSFVLSKYLKIDHVENV